MTETVFKLVRHHAIDSYASVGWEKVKPLRPCHHDFWGTIMVWKGDGEPIQPEEEAHECDVSARTATDMLAQSMDREGRAELRVREMTSVTAALVKSLLRVLKRLGVKL